MGPKEKAGRGSEMTKQEALEALYTIRSALVMANKLNPCEENEEALVLATQLILQSKRRIPDPALLDMENTLQNLHRLLKNFKF